MATLKQCDRCKDAVITSDYRAANREHTLEGFYLTPVGEKPTFYARSDQPYTKISISIEGAELCRKCVIIVINEKENANGQHWRAPEGDRNPTAEGADPRQGTGHDTP